MTLRKLAAVDVMVLMVVSITLLVLVAREMSIVFPLTENGRKKGKSQTLVPVT
jgi:hypothetical protein